MHPVQDDEAHAADHDQEAAKEEGSGLGKQTISNLTNAFDQGQVISVI